jgi:ADP-ribose pyrophosphatase YjhB (NUDIX family)
VAGVGAVILVSAADGALVETPAALPDPHGVVLIRRRFEPMAGQWSLPGGALEVGELLEEGVAREVLEETGLAIHVGPIVEVFDRIVRDHDGRVQYHFVLVDYLCRPRGGRLRAGSDVSEAVVADPRALEGFALHTKTLAVIARAIDLSELWA